MKKRFVFTVLLTTSCILMPLSCGGKQDVYYNVKFVNYNGDILEEKKVKEGKIPSYTSTDPVKPQDEDYRYKFTEWSPKLEAIYQDTTYTAQYREIKRCVVVWVDDTGTEIKIDDDTDEESIHYTGTVPSKVNEGDKYYYFAGWKLDEVKNINGKDTYTIQAQFKECKKEDDRDYDGLVDYLDPTPEEANFNCNATFDNVTVNDADFKFDYKKMFVDGDNKVFNKDIAKLGAIINTDYFQDTTDNVVITEDVTPKDNKEKYPTIFKRLGFSKYINVSTDTSVTLDKNDQIKAKIYHQKINAKDYSSNNVEDDYRDLFIVPIIYYDATAIEDWLSNVDLGCNSNEYFSKEGNEHEQVWLDNTKYFKGFNIAANRIKDKINDSINNLKEVTDKEPIVFLTGHSRPGSVANILGDMFNKDNDKKMFTYCYAPCNTYFGDEDTTNKNIFNIVNNDDFIPQLPCSFFTENNKIARRHGITKSMSLGSNLSNTYKRKTGQDYYYVSGINGTLKSYLNGKTREDLYTCKDKLKLSKSKSTYIDIIKTMNPKLSEDDINKYFIFEENSNGLTVKTCVMGIFKASVGLVAGGTVEDLDTAKELVNNYTSLALSLVTSGLTSVESVQLPHQPTSYYIITSAL